MHLQSVFLLSKGKMKVTSNEIFAFILSLLLASILFLLMKRTNLIEGFSDNQPIKVDPNDGTQNLVSQISTGRNGNLFVMQSGTFTYIYNRNGTMEHKIPMEYSQSVAMNDEETMVAISNQISSSKTNVKVYDSNWNHIATLVPPQNTSPDDISDYGKQIYIKDNSVDVLGRNNLFTYDFSGKLLKTTNTSVLNTGKRFTVETNSSNGTVKVLDNGNTITTIQKPSSKEGQFGVSADISDDGNTVVVAGNILNNQKHATFDGMISIFTKKGNTYTFDRSFNTPNPNPGGMTTYKAKISGNGSVVLGGAGQVTYVLT